MKFHWSAPPGQERCDATHYRRGVSGGPLLTRRMLRGEHVEGDLHSNLKNLFHEVTLIQLRAFFA